MLKEEAWLLAFSGCHFVGSCQIFYPQHVDQTLSLPLSTSPYPFTADLVKSQTPNTHQCSGPATEDRLPFSASAPEAWAKHNQNLFLLS